jgi:two-component system, sensor histidine kinase and response regulator
MAQILVIEDDQNVRETLHRVLDRAGYETRSAGDGLQGVHLAQAHPPDLVISDVRMPYMDGYTVLRTLRHNPHTQTVPIILLTALADRAAMRQGMSLGADDYLPKPFEVEDLLKAVQTQLAKSAVHQEKHDTSLRILRKNIIYALPHEMRTPLQQIMGYAQLLEMAHEDAQPDDILEASQAITRASQRLGRLIENYLVYAQLELLEEHQMTALRNHITPRIPEVIRSVAQAKALDYQRVDDLKLDLCELAALRIAPEDLNRILTEFIDNAFKFSQPGTPVILQTRKTDAHFRLVIRDHGRGLTPEQIEQIGAYMQFERTYYEQQGLGLGMIIARRLVELHQGKVVIKSPPKQGTAIVIQWPL